MRSIIAKIKEFLAAEKQKLEGKPTQEKLEYVWEYYKFAIIATVAIVASIIYTIVAISSEKDAVLSGYLLESYVDPDQTTVLGGFNDYAQIDTENCEADFIVNLSISNSRGEIAAVVQQRLFATVVAGETDFIAAPTSTFPNLAYQETSFFADLREFLTAEQLEKLQDRIFYVDAALKEELAKLPLNEPVVLPDPYDPDSMKEPIPIGIDVQGHEELDVLYLGVEEHVYLGIVGNAPHPEMLLTFIEYLLS